MPTVRGTQVMSGAIQPGATFTLVRPPAALAPEPEPPQAATSESGRTALATNHLEIFIAQPFVSAGEGRRNSAGAVRRNQRRAVPRVRQGVETRSMIVISRKPPRPIVVSSRTSA